MLMGVGLFLWAVPLSTRFLKAGKRLCPDCGYDLKGITGVTCPECGAPVGTPGKSRDAGPDASF